MPANTAPVCRAPPVQIPFSKEQFQFKTLVIMKPFGKKRKKTMQLLEFSSVVLTLDVLSPW